MLDGVLDGISVRVTAQPIDGLVDRMLGQLPVRM